uniref:Uncharacterized protein n=1 Tax=Physcomitrium patens TaxID=3218 RepID=A0A2K1J2H9_PHYPA|nr:hypothetical protein PHYPA_021576 [Physcomitrium patens]
MMRHDSITTIFISPLLFMLFLSVVIVVVVVVVIVFSYRLRKNIVGRHLITMALTKSSNALISKHQAFMNPCLFERSMPVCLA